MFSTWELDKLGSDVDFVRRIVDCLSATATNIILVPAVAIELVLLTRVSEIYRISNWSC